MIFVIFRNTSDTLKISPQDRIRSTNTNVTVIHAYRGKCNSTWWEMTLSFLRYSTCGLMGHPEWVDVLEKGSVVVLMSADWSREVMSCLLFSWAIGKWSASVCLALQNLIGILKTWGRKEPEQFLSTCFVPGSLPRSLQMSLIRGRLGKRSNG